MRYKITLSYDGSEFCGWQIQPEADTIQGRVEKALSTLLKCDISLTGAGRTDSKVNAVNYVAHFDSPLALDTTKICYKLNAILPKSIIIHNVSEVDEAFHSRFGAAKREYTYFLHRKKDPFAESYSYRYQYPIDVDLMNEAASYLVGTHDFSCFEKVGAGNKTSVCTCFEAGWHSYSPDHVRICGFQSEEGDYLYFRISADRFLRNMVRAIVGSLLDVGRGKKTVEQFKELIKESASDCILTRSDAGESVPGNALFLNKVEY